MPMLQGADALIILAIVVLLFGSTLIPKLARSFGDAARELKAVKEESNDSAPSTKA